MLPWNTMSDFFVTIAIVLLLYIGYLGVLWVLFSLYDIISGWKLKLRLDSKTGCCAYCIYFHPTTVSKDWNFWDKKHKRILGYCTHNTLTSLSAATYSSVMNYEVCKNYQRRA